MKKELESLSAGDLKKRYSPSDVDLSEGLKATFGISEYEDALVKVIQYLQDDSRNAGIPDIMFLGNTEGWGKRFRIDTIEGISPEIFAMLAGSGWIKTGYFPKYTFTISDAALMRLAEMGRFV